MEASPTVFEICSRCNKYPSLRARFVSVVPVPTGTRTQLFDVSHRMSKPAPIFRIYHRELIRIIARQHDVVPELSLVSDVTHVALAFMRSSVFNKQDNCSDWPLFTTVDAVRSKFSVGTSIIVAIGGWGDTQGFSEAASTDEGRKLFARNVKRMIDNTGADGTLYLLELT